MGCGCQLLERSTLLPASAIDDLRLRGVISSRTFGDSFIPLSSFYSRFTELSGISEAFLNFSQCYSSSSDSARAPLYAFFAKLGVSCSPFESI